jgi:ABC-2 type transport system ATP-binding protein
MDNNILLSIKNLAKTYPGTKPVHALKNVNLDIMQGEVLSLLGVNGAGKTTLSTIIATLHPASAGIISYQGKSIYDDVIEFRRIIGFCPQKPNIDEQLTLQENLIFAGRYFNMPHELIHERATYLMNKFGLHKYQNDRGSILSGGYRQRFVLARTLMHSPKLIILDEPTVALDPHIRRNVWDMIKELKQEGVTVLLTTHYLEEAEILSDRVCILDGGVIKLIDTPENLKQKFSQKNLENVFIKLMQENNPEQ